VLAGESFWRAAVNFDFLADEGVVDEVDCSLFTYCEMAEDIWATIRDGYARKRRTPARR
jgi:hypothetical protein